MLTKKKGLIVMRTERIGIPAPLFAGLFDAPEEEPDEEDEEFDLPEDMTEPGEPEKAEMLMEGRLVCTSERAELMWEESELTGMEGATSKIGFAHRYPELISMLRSGSVDTALVFEPRRRHVCVYNTPFSAFEVCVQGIAVENTLLKNGKLHLDYLIEIRGNRTERCRMWIEFRESAQA